MSEGGGRTSARRSTATTIGSHVNPKHASSTTDAASLPPSELVIDNIEVIYDEVILVLRGLSLTIPAGEIVALLGPNGAGKSTTLKAVSGLLASEHGEVSEGHIHFAGEEVTQLDAPTRVRQGMSLCMEGRHVFEHLTVAENLVAGAYATPRGQEAPFDMVYDLFPRLAAMKSRTAGYLSGGEQQMLAIGRALMARPRLLMLDEPSLGLAPLLVTEIFDRIQQLNEELGLTVLLVEQNARQALRIADRGFILEQGRIVLEGSAEELSSNPDVQEFYLGVGEAGSRRSFRDVKHYKRRKRWL